MHADSHPHVIDSAPSTYCEQSDDELNPQTCGGIANCDVAQLVEFLDAELQAGQEAEPSECCHGATLTERWNVASRAALPELWSCFGPVFRDRACSAAQPLCFSATIARSRGQRRLGLECVVPPECSNILLVVGIDSGGMAELWNQRCAEEHESWRRLHHCSAILSVNGVEGDDRCMLRELEKDGDRPVELRVCNPPCIWDALVALRVVHGLDLAACEAPFWLRVPKAESVSMAVPDVTPDISVIVTTSPVPSNPSTNMLRSVLSSLSLVPGLAGVPRILVCDGFKVAGSGRKPRHKAGLVRPEDGERYRQFIARVRSQAEDAWDERSAFGRLQVLESEEHIGFGHAVKLALDAVRTTFVLVVQHDQEFVRPFELEGVLQAMTRHSERLQYVGLCSLSTLHYDSTALTKYGLKLRVTEEFGVPLMPLIFFYDKPHIASVRYYRDIVFGPDSVVRRGDFIEETFGKLQREDIVQNGLLAHGKHGLYQLDDRNEAGEPLATVRHINGRAFFSPEQRLERGWPACVHFKL